MSYKTTDVVTLTHRDKAARTDRTYTIDIWDQDKTKFIDGASCTHLANGIYYYDYARPPHGSYVWRFYCADNESTGDFTVEPVGATTLPSPSNDLLQRERFDTLSRTVEEINKNVAATPLLMASVTKEVKKIQTDVANVRKEVVASEKRLSKKAADRKDMGRIVKEIEGIQKSADKFKDQGDLNQRRISKESKSVEDKIEKALGRMDEVVKTTSESTERATKEKVDELKKELSELRDVYQWDKQENQNILKSRLEALDSREAKLSELNDSLIQNTSDIISLAKKEKSTTRLIAKDEKALEKILDAHRGKAKSMLFKGANKNIRVNLKENKMEGDRISKEFWAKAYEAVKAGGLYTDFKGVGKEDEKIIKNILSNGFKQGSAFDLTKTIEQIRDNTSVSFDKAELIVRTEQTAIVNKARELGYEERDPEGEFKYKWSVKHDHRTSQICKDIETQVSSMGGGKGVSMPQIKAIMKAATKKHMGAGWEYRDWTPHPRCRSTLVRMI